MGLREAVVFTFSLLSLVGCSAEPPASQEQRPAIEGVYRGDAESSFSWASFDGGRYVFWKSGEACNTDYAKAPAGCAETGTFEVDHTAQRITFTDDATGEVREHEVRIEETQTHGALTERSGTALSQRGVSVRQFVGSGELLESTSQPLVATKVNIVKKGLMVVFTACNLLGPDPEQLPEPKPPPPVEQSKSAGCKGGGDKPK